MKGFFIAFMLLALFAQPALAHRLDEYLQATVFSIEPGQVRATMRLVPGVAVADGVISRIDLNHDGVLSANEQHAYAEQVLADLQLKEDNRSLPLHLLGVTFPTLDQMNAGTGEIELAFSADLSSGRGAHKLTFENHHQSSLSVYLVNSLIPQDRAVQLGAQDRNRTQSFYQIQFSLAGAAKNRAQGLSWSGFGGAFRLGARHIAEGTDHLLFLMTLLLPAPLLATAGRWRRTAKIRQSLLHMLGIVTAFTVGHSLTLALAAFDVVHAPARPVEILIAVSILVSALHAIRPLLPGREAIIAVVFGLIHGLAFASALSELGMTGWYRLVSLLGFNLGIETMQLAVVAVALPALLLLSRTRIYQLFRISGASVSIVAASAWIAERATGKPNAIAGGIEQCAQHGMLLAACLWALSAIAWCLEVQQGSYTPRPAL